MSGDSASEIGNQFPQQAVDPHLPFRNFRPALLEGWCRVFSLVSLNRIKRGKTRPQDRELAALALRPGSEADAVWGVLLDIPSAELPAYREREARYAFETVTCLDASQHGGQVRALVCVESTDEAYRRDPARFPQDEPAHSKAWHERVGAYYDTQVHGPLWGRPDVLPASDYLELCLAAAADLGSEAWLNFVSQTYLVDGETPLATYILQHSVCKLHPSFDSGPCFVFMGVSASRSSALELWQGWWSQTGAASTCPAILPLDVPLPLQSGSSAQSLYLKRLRCVARAVLLLPPESLCGMLITSHKTAMYAALHEASSRDPALYTVQPTAELLGELSGVTRTRSADGRTAVQGVALDATAMAAVLDWSLGEMQLIEVDEASRPTSSTLFGDCWVDGAFPATLQPLGTVDAAQVTSAPSCVAGAAADAESPTSAWFRARPGADAVILGAGGAGLACAVALLGSVRSATAASPRRIVLVDTSQAAAAHTAAVLREAVAARAGDSLSVLEGEGLPSCAKVGGICVVLAASQSASSMIAREAVQQAGAGSLVVNATGMGKDTPGCPVPMDTAWPAGCIVWELNYRGPRQFLNLALAQAPPGSLIMDGRRLLHTGWTRTASALARALALSKPAATPPS